MADRTEVKKVLTDNGRQFYFTKTAIGKMFGFRSMDTINKFIRDIPEHRINGKPMYFVNDILRKIEQSKVS